MPCTEGIEGIIVSDSVNELDVDRRQTSQHEFQIDQQSPRPPIAVDERLDALESNVEPR